MLSVWPYNKAPNILKDLITQEPHKAQMLIYVPKSFNLKIAHSIVNKLAASSYGAYKLPNNDFLFVTWF